MKYEDWIKKQPFYIRRRLRRLMMRDIEMSLLRETNYEKWAGLLKTCQVGGK